MTLDGAPGHPRADDGVQPSGRLPFAIYVLALGTFLMGTSEFVVAGLLPEIADDLHVTVAKAGLLITVFAVGIVVGAPLMALLTSRLDRRVALILALGVFVAGHVVVALGSSFGLLLGARFVTALATGAFWAVANVSAMRIAGSSASARAASLVSAGAMVANIVGVPLGAFAGHLLGWRGPFWALAALSAAAVGLVARYVPQGSPDTRAVSIRSEMSALRSGRIWLVLVACAATVGGVMSAYSYVAPLLTDQAGVAADLLPLVLVGFGISGLAGTVVGGRLGDRNPHVTTVVAAASTTVVLLALGLISAYAVPTVALVVMLGFFGLCTGPVFFSLAVRYAGRAALLASALCASAYNIGTAVGSWLSGLTLDSALGATGPAVVGTVISTGAVIATIALAVIQRRRSGSAPVAATTAPAHAALVRPVE